MASASTTSLLLPAIDHQSLVASVVAADATATTYFLNCPATPPSGKPTTGAFDIHYSVGGFDYSAHYPMSHTIVNGACTIISIGGNNDGTKTVTVTSGDDAFTDKGLNAFTYYPVTITAGLERLSAAATATAATATKTSGSASATETGTATRTGTATGTTAASGSAASTSGTSTGTASSGSAASARVPAGLFGLLAASLALAVVSAF